MSILAAIYLATFTFDMPKADMEGSPVNGLLTPRIYCGKGPTGRLYQVGEGEPAAPLTTVSVQVELGSGTWFCYVTVVNHHGIESKPTVPVMIVIP